MSSSRVICCPRINRETYKNTLSCSVHVCEDVLCAVASSLEVSRERQERRTDDAPAPESERRLPSCYRDFHSSLHSLLTETTTRSLFRIFNDLGSNTDTTRLPLSRQWGNAEKPLLLGRQRAHADARG